jgi:methane/ammonia monooxygenase subunit C
MSTSTQAAGATAKEQPLLNIRHLILAIAGLSVLYISVRWYEGLYGWSAGLDAFAPEFETYWMNLFYTAIVLETITAALLWGWLWRTRDPNLERYWAHFMDTETVLTRKRGAALWELLWKTRDRSVVVLTPREELRRNMTHLIWLAAYAWAFYWGVSFFTEQDATWHQTVVRDTDFTPNHIIAFYFSYPVYIITGGGAFLYAKTRLPFFAKGLSVPYLCSVIGPFTLLPNVGYNEWGHTFWFMEEIFVAPLHYGFVIFGWFALSIGGVLLQVFASTLYLIKKDLCQESNVSDTSGV